jgi:hypothetical protein
MIETWRNQCEYLRKFMMECMLDNSLHHNVFYSNSLSSEERMHAVTTVRRTVDQSLGDLIYATAQWHRLSPWQARNFWRQLMRQCVVEIGHRHPRLTISCILLASVRNVSKIMLERLLEQEEHIERQIDEQERKDQENQQEESEDGEDEMEEGPSARARIRGEEEHRERMERGEEEGEEEEEEHDHMEEL